MTDSDLQISKGGGGGGVLPIMTYVGRFRHFRLKGVIFSGCLGFRYEWVGKVEVEDYGKSNGINTRCILWLSKTHKYLPA